MKKIAFVFLGFLVFSAPARARADDAAYFITKCIGFLGKPVPDGFQRMNRTVFKNDEDIILFTENNTVFLSGYGSAFETTNEAHDFNSLFYNYFEDNNWVYYDEINQGDIYTKNKIYACISYPSRRDDGLIAGMVLFSSNAAVFFE